MKRTLSTYDVAGELMADKNAAWSRAGAYALAEHIEQLEQDLGEETELDVCAIRCEFSEFSNATLAALAYDWQKDEEKSDEENEADALEYLNENTSVIQFDGGLIIQDF
jgi:hypothetical protein